MPNSRDTPFKADHMLLYGLEIAARDVTNEVTSVRCRFCVNFGKEDGNSEARKRKLTDNIKYFRKPFRVDNYKSHLKVHSNKWIEYNSCSLDEKKRFFGTPTENYETTSSSSQPIIELREYELKPEHSDFYIQATTEAADLRKAYVPLRFFSLPETGGQLLVATHAYYYSGGHGERNAKRAVLAADARWREYTAKCRQCFQAQRSTVWTEAPFIKDMAKESNLVHGLATIPDSFTLTGNMGCILELRRYKLKPGCDTVPQFLDLYKSGLQSKINAVGSDPSTSLVTVMYSEIGQSNEVIEIWRHGNGAVAMEVSQEAAKNAPEWCETIESIIDQFVHDITSVIHKPTSFSPIPTIRS